MIKVLAVDDEAPIRKWLEYCISQMDGFACITAQSAAEGIELFKREQPQIVLSDIEMPGTSGLEMLSEIHAINSEACLIVLTSHSDFSYARSALKIGTAEYMLKAELTEETIKSTLQKSVDTLRLQQNKRTHSRLSQEHFLQGIALQKAPCILSLDDLLQQDIRLSNSPAAAVDCFGADSAAKAEQFVKAAFDAAQIYSFSVETKHVTMLFNTSLSAHEIPLRANAELAQNAEQYTGMYFGVSDIIPTPCSLRTATDKARARCMFYYYTPGCRIFCDGAPADISRSEEAFQLEYMQALLSQNFGAAYKCVTDFLQIIRDKRPTDIGNILKTLCVAASSFLHFAKDTSEDADKCAQTAKAGIQNAADISALEAEMRAIFTPLLDSITATEGLTTPMRQAIAFMEKHYAEKITLGDIAKTAAFSPEHFSRLFSKETGINFVTYLNNLRMKQAVTLLETTTLKVYEIAEQVGFSSLSYFSTAFKKKFGQNPYEYQINFQKSRGKAFAET